MRTEQPGASAFTELSDVPHTYSTFGGDILTVKMTEDGIEFTTGGPGGATAWGTITGTLSAQTDLQTALDGKVDENTAIVAGTATKITYDTKGLITVGAAATTADIADSLNKRYVTDTNLTVIGNTSGTNTGDNAVNSLYSGLASSKQDTLVSGTNIKTVNGNTLLGSGDVVVSASAAWGGITGTLSTQTDLQSALDAKVTDADVRGGAVNLNARLGTISNFASPNAGGVVTGQYYDNSFQGTASSALAGAANRIDLAPYYTSIPLAIDLIGVAVSTGVASALGKVVIYSTDTNGWPDELLFESGNLDFATTGYKSVALTFTFSSGVQYWIGVRHSSTAALRTINVSSAVNLGLTSSTAANYATIIRRTVTFANAAPDPWTFTNSDRVANVTPPSIRFRAA